MISSSIKRDGELGERFNSCCTFFFGCRRHRDARAVIARCVGRVVGTLTCPIGHEEARMGVTADAAAARKRKERTVASTKVVHVQRDGVSQKKIHQKREEFCYNEGVSTDVARSVQDVSHARLRTPPGAPRAVDVLRGRQEGEGAVDLAWGLTFGVVTAGELESPVTFAVASAENFDSSSASSTDG